MRKHLAWGITLIVCLAVFGVCFAATGGDVGGMLAFQEPFEEISEVAYCEGGTIALIDSFRGRVLFLEESGTMLGSYLAREGAELHHAAVTQGGAYVVERGADGDALIALSRGGKASRRAVSGDVFGILPRAEDVELVIREGGAYRLESADGNDKSPLDAPGEAPWMFRAGADGALYMLEYSGRIWNVGEGRLLLDPAGVSWREYCIPGGIAVDPQGTLWIVNLGSRRIGSVREGRFVPRFSQEDVVAQGSLDIDNTGFYSLAMAKGHILTAIGSRLILRAPNGVVQGWSGAKLPPLTVALKILALAGTLGYVAAALRFLFFGLRRLRGVRLSLLTGQAIQFVVFVLVFGVAVGVNFVQSFSYQFSVSREGWLRQTALLGAVDITQSGALSLGEEDPEGARALLSERLAGFTSNARGEVEATVVVVESDSIRVLAQTHEEVPLFYPLRTDLRSEQEDGLSYRAALEDASIRFGVVEDARGRWETCLCPIFDGEGNVVALLDARVDADQFQSENSGMFLETLLSAASIVVVLLFFFIEVNRLMAVMMEPGGAGQSPLTRRRPLVRWLGFLAYTAINIPMFFIPIQAAAIFERGSYAFLTRDAAAALPLTMNMLAMAISSTVFAGWVEKKGWKPGALLGIALCAGGYILAMALDNILWYIGMLFVAGFGVGLIALSLQTYIFASAPPDDTNSDHLLSILNSGMYAGANCGVIFGSLLADQAGYLAAFLAAVAVFALTAACAMRLLRNGTVASEAGEAGGMSPLRFLMNGRVVVFLVLLLVPVTVLSFFVAHFLPIFADLNGVSSTLASWGYLLNGIAIIYLGPILTRTLLRSVGSRAAVLITAGIALAGIAVFAAVPVIPAAFLCSLLLGVSDAGGQVSRQEEFLRLPQSRRAGASRALSTFSLFENIGQTAGPGVFSLIVAVGVQPGMLALVAVTAVCFVLYMITSAEKKSVRAGASGDLGA